MNSNAIMLQNRESYIPNSNIIQKNSSKSTGGENIKKGLMNTRNSHALMLVNSIFIVTLYFIRTSKLKHRKVPDRHAATSLTRI